MELNGEYSAHAVTDRRIIRNQMAVNGPQTACLIWVSSSPQALCNLTVCFTVVYMDICICSVYMPNVYGFITWIFFVYMFLMYTKSLLHLCTCLFAVYLHNSCVSVWLCTCKLILVYQTAYVLTALHI